jgi:hypothetical protein
MQGRLFLGDFAGTGNSFPSRPVRTAVLVLAVLALTGRGLADDLPTFNDQSLNSFVKTYSQFIDSYVDAAKSGDASKLATVQAKEGEIQRQLMQATQAAGKLDQEANKSFTDFLARYKEKILPYYRYSVADVNSFVTKYAQFVDNYVAAVKNDTASKSTDSKAKEEKELQQQALQAAGKLRKGVEGKLFQEEALFPEFLTTYTQKVASYIALSYKYIDDSINAFIEKYSKFVDDYVTAIKAAQTGDISKLSDIQTRAKELQAEAVPAAKKLKDGETTIFQSFIAQEIAKISDASK